MSITSKPAIVRVAIYSRISTRDHGQDAENQLAALRAWAAAAGHQIVHEYIDEGVSGSAGAAQRPQLAAMLLAAHQRQFDVLACWALDRLSREGMVATVGYLDALNRAGVGFHSHTEPALCTTNKDEFSRGLMVAIMSALAKAERTRISERTIAGLDRVRAKGVRLGRPGLDDATRARIVALAGEGLSSYAIGKRLRLDPKSVQKYRPAAALAEAAD